jgi:putative CocE/NonD family hydrolase
VSDPFVAGTKRTSAWAFYAPGVGGELTTASGPDNLRYLSAPFATNTAIAGPINSTLYVASTAPDTELFVELSDVYPDGTEMRLQRGMLKASHRDYIAEKSDYNADGELIRPYRKSKNTLLNILTPGQPTKLEVEIFPVGHVFRPGHRLLVRVTSPPAVDSLNVYVPSTPPAVNQVHRDTKRPSSILLPFVPVSGDLGPELPCGAQVGLDHCPKPLG